MLIYEMKPSIGFGDEISIFKKGLRIIETKREIMNQYNNKRVLMEVLEGLGASEELSNNDIVLNTIVTLFRDELELFDFSTFDYFSSHENTVELLENTMKRLCSQNYNFLKGRILIEQDENSCSLKIAKQERRKVIGRDLYATGIEEYQRMLSNIGSSKIIGYIAHEIYYDKKTGLTTYQKQELTPNHSGRDIFDHDIFVEVNTSKEKYGKENILIEKLEQRFCGMIPTKGVQFFDEFTPCNQTRIYVQGESVNAIQEVFDRERDEVKIYTLSDLPLSYEKVYDDYIKGNSVTLDSEGQERDKDFIGKKYHFLSLEEDGQPLNYATIDYKNIIGDRQLRYYQRNGISEEEYSIVPNYKNFMGFVYKVDNKLMNIIQSELHKKRQETFNKEYVKKMH